jgi:hypothetical protein
LNLPQTAEGIETWDLLERCSGQIRAGMGGPTGLDFNAVFAMADALGYARTGVAELIPAGEAGMLLGYAKLAREEGDGKP